MTFQWFDKDGVAVNLHHYHDIYISTLGPCWELPSLIGESCFPGIVDLDVNIAYLLAVHLFAIE